METYIYRVVNKIDGKCYIGKSIDPEQRFHNHIRESRLKRSKNRKLYIAINKYGYENFYYEILEKTKDTTREKYWISYYNSYNNGYNHTRDGQGNKNIAELVGGAREITQDMINSAIESYKKDQA